MLSFTYNMALLYTLVSVVVVSLVSLIGILVLYFKKENLDKTLLLLVSLSVGTLLGGAFLHLLPEAAEYQGFTLQISFYVLAGILVFFIIEKFIHMHHSHKLEAKRHHHAYHLGFMNLLGDGIHNIIDGMVIAGSYIVDTNLGIATTITVILHEVPQEIADFGILLYSGLSKMKALLLNFLSAVLAIVGAVIGILLNNASESFVRILLPFAAGGFIYIAGSNLIPELHRKCKLIDTVLHLSAIVLGIVLMYSLLFLEV